MTISEANLFSAIGYNRGTKPGFASVDSPVTSSEFEYLGEKEQVLTRLRMMKERGFLTYSASDDQADVFLGITLTERGEEALRSSLVTTGETLD